MPFPESHPNSYNFITETPDDQEMQNGDSLCDREVSRWGLTEARLVE
jgi:hypothetical protein